MNIKANEVSNEEFLNVQTYEINRITTHSIMHIRRCQSQMLFLVVDRTIFNKMK